MQSAATDVGGRAGSTASRSTGRRSGCASAPSASSTRTSPSLSSRTLVYKGMVTTLQLEPFYPDLSDERFASKLALVHSRYSTNTFPSWPLAQPFRMIAHNGEINTVQGNRNWMRARQSQLESELLGDLAPLLPDRARPGASDSASFDEVVELLTLVGPQPAARDHDDGARGVGEPDRHRPRPAARSTSTTRCSWSRGTARRRSSSPTAPLVGATLDRNGLRPGRYLVTDDGLVVLASEIGVLDIDPSRRSCARAACAPARCSSSTPRPGRIIEDDEIKAELAASEPWGDWLDGGPHPRSPTCPSASTSCTRPPR